MKIGIVGAGPAGLYAAILLKRSRPDWDVRIIEQNPRNATWGFGVVFSATALNYLRRDDPETAALINSEMEFWDDIRIVHRGETVSIDGVGFSAIGRLKLLTLLQLRASEFGVQPIFDTRVNDLSVFDDCDIVIGADGLNSVVRAEAPQMYGQSKSLTRNWFCWYGTERPFDALTQTFVQADCGFFNAHHYRYAANLSTFIVECDEPTFNHVGFANRSESENRSICEQIFAETLNGARLVSNHSVWRQFPILSNRRWYSNNRVLVGDALHTAHYSIGSGTRLAMEDVIVLINALKESDYDIEHAFRTFQAERLPNLQKFTDAATKSALWYENFAQHMALSPWELACSYISRSGRITSDKLRVMSPKFSAELAMRDLNIEDFC